VDLRCSPPRAGPLAGDKECSNVRHPLRRDFTWQKAAPTEGVTHMLPEGASTICWPSSPSRRTPCELKDVGVKLPVPGTYKTWRRIPPPASGRLAVAVRETAASDGRWEIAVNPHANGAAAHSTRPRPDQGLI
jgi:hypothetical protein